MNMPQTLAPAVLPTPKTSETGRRAMDIFCAGAGIIVLSPMMIAIALAIWLETGRPILFSQFRLGRNGSPFRMYKFRKFGVQCDTNGCPLTVEGDARLTLVGRFLAATKLDEMPQLWNVLMGEMSIVGPRPESLAFADCFRDGFERILDYRPGLLGPCQILFRHESRLYPAGRDPTAFYRQVLFPIKVSIDLAYFPRRTFASDLKWILRGALAVFGWMPAERADLITRPK